MKLLSNYRHSKNVKGSHTANLCMYLFISLDVLAGYIALHFLGGSGHRNANRSASSFLFQLSTNDDRCVRWIVFGAITRLTALLCACLEIMHAERFLTKFVGELCKDQYAYTNLQKAASINKLSITSRTEHYNVLRCTVQHNFVIVT